MRPEVRRFKDQSKLFMPCLRLAPDLPLWVSLAVYDNWYYKNGKMRRLDVQNLVKVTVDAICEKAGIDDCVIWEITAKKKQELKRTGIEVELKQEAI